MTGKRGRYELSAKLFVFVFPFFLVRLLARRNYAAAPDPSKKTPRRHYRNQRTLHFCARNETPLQHLPKPASIDLRNRKCCG
ncbi:hypothetical protein VTO58DRAFT_108082 [Aureobasidium pullulans]